MFAAVRVVTHVHRLGTDELGTPFDQLDVAFRQVRAVDVVEAFDVRVALGFELGPVDERLVVHVEAVVLQVLHHLGHAGAVVAQLLRDAADVDARASERTAFDDSYTRTVFGGPASAGNTAGPSADD
ncbi:hypothetical protein MRX96_022590 [Rhipicephalus microplus]